MSAYVSIRQHTSATPVRQFFSHTHSQAVLAVSEGTESALTSVIVLYARVATICTAHAYDEKILAARSPSLAMNANVQRLKPPKPKASKTGISTRHSEALEKSPESDFEKRRFTRRRL